MIRLIINKQEVGILISALECYSGLCNPKTKNEKQEFQAIRRLEVTLQETIKKRLPGHDLLDRSEAAKYLGVSRRSVEQWATVSDQGRSYYLPYILIGNRAMYSVEDLDKLLKEHPRETLNRRGPKTRRD